MMLVTFHNLTVSLEAKSAKDAYSTLCNLLAKADPNIDWVSDTYSTHTVDHRSTDNLFPR